MEMMVGKYTMESMSGMDAMTKAMGMSEDMMKKMIGSPGMMLEIMVNGDCMKMKQSDGMCMSFAMGKQFEMPVGNTMMKVMPRMEGDMLMMMMRMPDDSMAKRSYSFNKMGMQMEMMFKEMVMTACYMRM